MPAVFIGLLLFGAWEAYGQMVYGQPKILQGRVIYQSWKLTVGDEELNLTQSAFPFSFLIPVKDNWEIHFASAVSRSNLDVSQTDATLTSFSGTTLRAYRAFADDRLFASVGLQFPSGASEFDSVEVLLAALVSDDYLTTPVKQIAQGFGVVAQLGAASEAAYWLVYGASISYNLNGSFTYLEGADDYNPGDEISLQFSATASASDNSATDLDLSYRHYFADQSAGREVFKSGGVMSVLLGQRNQFDRIGLNAYVSYIMRQKNSILFGNSLQSEDQNSNSNKLMLGGTLSYLISPAVRASVLGGYRSLSANDYSESSSNFFGKSDVYSFGGGLDYTASNRRFTVFSRLVLNNGKANKSAAEEQEIDVAGTEFSFGGRLSF